MYFRTFCLDILAVKEIDDAEDKKKKKRGRTASTNPVSNLLATPPAPTKPKQQVRVVGFQVSGGEEDQSEMALVR